MNIKPLGKRVLVKRDTSEDNRPSGIILTSKEKSLFGTIVEVSEELSGSSSKFGFDLDPTLKVGDRVLLPLGGSTEIKINNEKLELFPIENIYGKVNE